MKSTLKSKNPSSKSAAVRPHSPSKRESSTTNGAEAVPDQRPAKKVPPTPSAVVNSPSMTAIKEDRVTLYALYALFGAVLAGIIYFFAIIFLS